MEIQLVAYSGDYLLLKFLCDPTADTGEALRLFDQIKAQAAPYSMVPDTQADKDDPSSCALSQPAAGSSQTLCESLTPS